MNTIRIDRSSIKKNKHAGGTSITMPGRCDITFSGKGMVPDYITAYETCHVTTWTLGEDAEYSGVVAGYLDEEMRKRMMADGVRVDVEHHPITIYHAPTPKYRYNYENTPCQCEECLKDIPYHSITEDCNDDGCYPICPNCGAYNSFTYTFEKIDDVTGELQL